MGDHERGDRRCPFNLHEYINLDEFLDNGYFREYFVASRVDQTTAEGRVEWSERFRSYEKHREEWLKEKGKRNRDFDSALEDRRHATYVNNARERQSWKQWRKGTKRNRTKKGRKRWANRNKGNFPR